MYIYVWLESWGEKVETHSWCERITHKDTDTDTHTDTHTDTDTDTHTDTKAIDAGVQS